MELHCGICLVRPWRESDAAAITPHANDRDVWLNLRDRFPHPYRTADAVEYIRSVASQRPPVSFVIVVGDDPAGGIGLRLGEDIERRSAEIGYWIGCAYLGRGIITAAVRAVTTYAFASLRSEEHTSELQSLAYLVCRLLLEKKKKKVTWS